MAILLSLLLFVCFLFLRMPCSARLLPHWKIHQTPVSQASPPSKTPTANTWRSWQRLSKYIASVQSTYTDFQIKTAHCDPENNVKSLCSNKKPALQQQRLAQECWSHRGLKRGACSALKKTKKQGYTRSCVRACTPEHLHAILILSKSKAAPITNSSSVSQQCFGYEQPPSVVSCDHKITRSHRTLAPAQTKSWTTAGILSQAEHHYIHPGRKIQTRRSDEEIERLKSVIVGFCGRSGVELRNCR